MRASLATALSPSLLHATLNLSERPIKGQHRYGPRYQMVDAVVEIAERLDYETRLTIGRAIARIPLVWAQAVVQSQHAAVAAGMAHDAPTHERGRVLLDLQDILVKPRNHGPLVPCTNDSAIGVRADQALIDLAQAMTVWDRCQPRVFSVFYRWLARLGYRQPLLGARAPHICGVVGVLGSPTNYYEAATLLGARSLEDGFTLARQLLNVAAPLRRNEAGHT